ncbi:invasion associated locus B family protein [Bartonella sp. LJL80]
MKKLLGSIAMAALLAVSSTAMAQDAKGDKPGTATLPNGASSLTETYGLWTVNCAVQNGEKMCAMIRQEVNAQNQPVLSMNVSTAADGNVSGVLVVPFGILVSKPVRLQVDDSKVVVDTSVRTCMPAGCIVPIAFDKNAVAGLRAGKQLKLTATSAGNGEPVLDNLFVQLDGFGGALDRLNALKK